MAEFPASDKEAKIMECYWFNKYMILSAIPSLPRLIDDNGPDMFDTCWASHLQFPKN